MNIVFEINHPGQVHLLKNVYRNLVKRKHSVTVFAKDEYVINYLLNVYDIPFTNLGLKGSGLYGKLLKQLSFDYKIWKYARKDNVEIAVGSSMTNDHVSFLTRMKSIHLSDDDEDVVPLIAKYSYPFSDTILAPDCLKFPKFKEKVINYAGTHELAYLHPNVFNPDIRVVQEAGLELGEKYFILRFVALKGHHDSGHSGLNSSQKKELVNLLLPYGRIIITSEKEIEPEFEQYRLSVTPEKIHSLMYYADLFIGDSQTMTSESAIMGVPAFKCNTFAGKLSVPNELEKRYGLCYSYHPSDFKAFLTHLRHMLVYKNIKDEWSSKRQKFLSDKIDVTAFIVWFIENYPVSKKTMMENPDYQYNFK